MYSNSNTNQTFKEHIIYTTYYFNVSDFALKRIVSGKTELSYSMYLRFKDLGIFNNLLRKQEINYDEASAKFMTLKHKMGYNNAQCPEILNVSIPTVKRLIKGKTKFNELYERLKELNII